MPTHLNRTRALVAVFASAAAVSLVAASGAQAAPTFLSPFNLSAAGRNAFTPQVAVDGQGNATFVWERGDGANDIIQARRRSAGGALGAVQDLSAAGQSARAPQVAVDGQGNATFVWSRFNGTNTIIQARRRSAGGALGAVEDLSAPGQSAAVPQVAVDGRGNATFVWRRFTDATNTIIQARRRSAGGALGAVEDLSALGASRSAIDRPQVAVDGQGNATFVWRRFNGTNQIIQARRRSAGGALGAVQDLSAARQNAESPQVAVDGQGNATFVWRRFDGAKDIVQARRRSAGGALGAVQDLSAAGQNAADPQVAVDGRGNASFVWRRLNGFAQIVQTRRRSAGGTLGAVEDLSEGGRSAFGPQVAVDGEGNASFVWSRSNGANDIIQARRRSAGGALGAVQDLSAAGRDANDPQVAVDGQGNATFVWRRFNDGANTIIQAAGLDVAGPQLRSLVVPRSGRVGQPLRFSVNPLDVWSPIAFTRFKFGDGQRAFGTSVTHTYRRAGSFFVCVTSADIHGNSTSVARTVRVRALPVPVPVPDTTLPVPVPDTTNPVIRRLRLSRKRFRSASGGCAIASPGQRLGRRVGTSLRYELSERADVKIAIERARKAKGRNVGGRCVKRTRRNRNRRRCTRFRALKGSLPDPGERGANRLRLTGRLRGQSLGLGRYRLVVRATDAAGNKSTRKRVRFRIVRR